MSERNKKGPRHSAHPPTAPVTPVPTGETHKKVPARKKTGRSSQGPDQPGEGAAKTAKKVSAHASTKARPARLSSGVSAADLANLAEVCRVAEESGLGLEGRYFMIAEAAYFRAERRGFSPGGELQDWLEAEAEVDELLQQLAAQSLA